MFSNFLKVLGIQGEQQQQGSAQQANKQQPAAQASKPAPTKSVAAQLNEDDQDEVPPSAPQKELKTYKGEVQEEDLFVESAPDTSPRIAATSPPSSAKRVQVLPTARQPDLFKQEKDDEESWLIMESHRARLSVIYAKPEGAVDEGQLHFLFSHLLLSHYSLLYHSYKNKSTPYPNTLSHSHHKQLYFNNTSSR